LNRQVFPSSLFPLRGDISAESGATSVIVQGLQGIPIIAPPVEPAGLDTLFYDSYNNDWFYASPWDIPVGTPLVWEGYGYGSSGISWIAPDTLAFGNGTDGDVSGAAAMTALVLFGSASYYGPYSDYDVDYGPSYDQFYTSIFSGATQNWNLILPPNPGTSGQVLTTNGSGVTYWETPSGGGGGGGSVTSFSSGNLSPLFTTSVATPTTTPALSFTLNTQAANLVFAGPTSGVAATPTFRALVAADLPAGYGPGGSNGDIQYNNSGAFGGSAATITSGGTLTIPTTQAIVFGTDTSISRISGGLVAFGTGSVGSEIGGIILNTINLGSYLYDHTDYAGANGWILSSTGSAILWINPATSLAVPGSTGDILYNNGGVMGASLATITAAGSITLPDTQTITWTGSAYSSVGLSQLAADTLAVGNGTESDVSGGMAMTALILYGSSYYPAYDAFQTTILSGATQDWTLVLPETAGVAGQVLVNIGSGFTEWESVSALGVPWSALTNPTANLTLAMGNDTTTFNYATGLAAAWTWANNTPTVTGASTTLALSTSTAPTPSGGTSWTYTLAASESGAGSNAWVNAAVTLSGYTGGATGNNGNFTITASTTTTITVSNPTGTTTNSGTPVVISSAVSSSPILIIAGTVNTGTAGTLNSVADTWSIQNVVNSVVPNPVTKLTITHAGSSGTPFVQIPSLQFPANPFIDINATGGIITFSQQNGTSTVGTISWGTGPGSFGLAVSQQGKTLFLQSNFTSQAGSCFSVCNASSFTATSGTVIGLNVGGAAGGTGGTNALTFNPASGTAVFQAVAILPTIEGTTSGNTTALLVNPTYTLTNLTGTNLLLDLQSSSTSKLSVNTSGVVTRVAGNATTKQGISSTISTSIKTAQAAALSGTSLVTTTPSAGMWRISFVATITTAATAAGVLGGTTGFTITYVNGNGDSVTKTTALSTPLGIGATNSTGDSASGDLYCYASSASAITYSYGYTAGTGTAMQYDIAVYAEFLG
jgi:hypothetical protein